jgi:Na+/melibiose symporter-like transporter
VFEAIAKTGIAHVIQLAVAPVFLLTSVGAILNVMANRLSRIIDRARVLELKLVDAKDGLRQELIMRLGNLSRRAKLISHAIAMCVVTAVLVCGTIVALFVGEFVGFNATVPAALLFIAALGVLLLSLVWLLREIFMATRTMKFGPG